MDIFSRYMSMITDAAWIMELVLLSVTWVIFSLRKTSVLKAAGYTAGMILILFLSNMALFFATATAGAIFPILWSCVHGLISLLFTWLFSPLRPREKQLLWIAMYNVVLSTAALSGQCSILVSSVSDNSFLIGAVRSGIYLLMPLSAVLMRRMNFDDFYAVPNNGLLLVGILLICEFALSIVEAIFFYSSTSVVTVFATAFACMLATDLVSVRALHTICQEQQNVHDLTAEKQRYLAEREISMMAETTLEDLRCIRHELKNQYGYLQILVEQKRYEELADYLQSLQNNLPQQLALIDCGNRVVNTVLNMEFSKLRGKGIVLEHQLVVPPVLPFRNEDICSILANLMDNAREECCRLQEKGRQDVRIRLEIYPHHSYLLIRCLNSTDRAQLQRKGLGLTSTKAESEYHGFGTRIIAKLSEKYNGCASFQLENGMFLAQAMLDMTGGTVYET